MNKSTTNRDFVENPAAGIVSRAELGKRILVNGHFPGILRYLGLINGKAGIFCGIELDEPLGKNDGTHEGVFYFECRPGHGIFAPCHKVQMVENDQNMEEGSKWAETTMNNKVPNKTPDKMSRSAIPIQTQQTTSNALLEEARKKEEKMEGGEWMATTKTMTSSAGTEQQRRRQAIVPTHQHQQQPPPPQSMEWSLMSMSTGSTNSEEEEGIRGDGMMTAMMTKFDEDLMAHSQATYTVFDSDCMMLSDLELSESALLRLDEDDDGDNDGQKTTTEWMARNLIGPYQCGLSESVVLEGPSLGSIGQLPVIGSPEPEEMPTPMVPERDFVVSELFGKQMLMLDEEDRRNRNHLALNSLRTGMQTRGGKEEEGDGEAIHYEHSKNLSPNNNNGNSSIAASLNVAAALNGKKAEEGGGTAAANRGKRDIRQQRNNNTASNKEQPEVRQEIKERKNRVSVFESIPMPMQNLSAAARAKPKQLSKTQLVMEQLKASMEAEKQRPKKEARAKTSSIPPPRVVETTTTSAKSMEMKEKTDELTTTKTAAQTKNIDEESMHCKIIKRNDSAAASNSRTAAQSTSTTQIHKAVTKKNLTSGKQGHILTTAQHSAESPSTTNIVKSSHRQLLNSKENAVSAIQSSALLKKPANASSSIMRKVLSPKRSNGNELFTIKTTEKFDGKTHGNSCKDVQIQVNTITQELAKEKTFGKKNKMLADVFMIVSSYLKNQITVADKELDILEGRLMHSNAEYAMRLHESELIWQSKLRENEEQHHNQQLDELRTIAQKEHEIKAQEIHEKNRRIVEQLNAELESLQERLKEQAQKHELELQENENERIKRLNNELESRQYELQLKNEELNKLRKKNRELQFEAEKLSEKDSQLKTVEKRNNDLLEQVNRLKQIEKRLLIQLEEYRLSLNESMARTKEFAMEREILTYQLQERGKHDQSLPSTPVIKQNSNTSSRDFSPGRDIATIINFRTPDQRRKSSDRPNSSCMSQGSRVQTNFEDDMSRSMDSALSNSIINCYRTEGKSNHNNTSTKIYTTTNFYEVDDGSTAKRTVGFEEHNDFTKQGNSSDNGMEFAP